MKKKFIIKLYFLIFTFAFTSLSYSAELNDPLPSWNDGPTKQSIINFVKALIDEKDKNYVSPANRIATIDNDGTLWVEQPMYTQGIFTLSQFKTLAEKHPELKQQASLKSAANNDYTKLSSQDIEHIFAITSSGMKVEDYTHSIEQWLATAKNIRFNRYYTELVYQPMLEVINYLHKNNFKVYIVSGGGQDFIRAFSQNTYNIPPEEVIGSTEKTQYTYKNKHPVLIKIPKMLFISNNTGKPEAINLFIGKKPIIAIGNSDGDKQMLEWTQSGPGKRLMLLVHHDDAKREYAYDTQSKIGTFSSALFKEAHKNNWHIISMKNDWKVIFPFERQ